MATNNIRCIYKGQVKTVALFGGLGAEDLNSILQAVFSITGNIIGFSSDVILPLRNECKL